MAFMRVKYLTINPEKVLGALFSLLLPDPSKRGPEIMADSGELNATLTRVLPFSVQESSAHHWLLPILSCF